MSAILSADDLNDFINPGVSCIKPVETLPQQQPAEESLASANGYEVTTEEKVNSGTVAPPAQISLTDCLACSGCVTSAEAVLVSLQSHGEVLDTLDRFQELKIGSEGVLPTASLQDSGNEAKVFVASVSPQARASLAATYNVTEKEAGFMVNQLLSGQNGLRSGGKNGSGFAWVVDTNAMREASLVAAADEVEQSLHALEEGQKKPIITSACPGWICYAEKTHPHILPHLSKLKSPQALTGVMLKSVLAKQFGISPQNVWHLAVMPCFDKKLEASRGELTSHSWHGQEGDAVRDVDCVITARELLMLAESRDISFPGLPKCPVSRELTPTFPDAAISEHLFGRPRGQKRKREEAAAVGTSGGYLHHILKTKQAHYPGSQIKAERGRNSDVAEYSIIDTEGQSVFKAARYYGFRNIQNLVRRLKPPKVSRMPGATGRKMGVSRRPNGATAGGNENQYAYVEVMACPGGCTNGGGQIKVGDVATLRQVGGTGIENGSDEQAVLPAQKEWLAKVDEAYWSAESDDLTDSDGDVEVNRSSPARDSVMSGTEDAGSEVVDGIDRRYVKQVLDHWANITGVGLETLLQTTYRVVQSDVGKDKPGGDVDRVNALAHAAGGGW